VWTSLLIGAIPRHGQTFAARLAAAGPILDPYTKTISRAEVYAMIDYLGDVDADGIDDLETRIEVNSGNPLSDEELARKFHDNVVRSLPEERTVEIAARTLALPDAQSVQDLTALLTSAGER